MKWSDGENAWNEKKSVEKCKGADIKAIPDSYIYLSSTYARIILKIHENHKLGSLA